MLKQIFLVFNLLILILGCSDKSRWIGTLTVDEEVYQIGDKIEINWTIIGAEIGDCIAIAESKSPIKERITYKETNGRSSGTIYFRAGGYDKKYEARYFKKCSFDKENFGAKSEPFTISYK